MRIIVKGAEGGDDFGGGLEATEERRHEDAVDRETEVVAELLSGAECPDFTCLDQRRVPPPGGRHCPHRLEVVYPVAVPHYDDVLPLLLRLSIARRIHRLRARERADVFLLANVEL